MKAPGPLSCTAALAVTIALARCGSEDTPAGQPAKATTAAKSELPPERIAFRRWLDDARTHGAIFTWAPTGPARSRSPGPGRLRGRHARLVTGRPADRLPALWREPPVLRLRGRRRRRRAREVKFRCRLTDCDASGPAWTPDGRLIATVEQGAVRTFGGVPQIQESALDDRPSQRQAAHGRPAHPLRRRRERPAGVARRPHGPLHALELRPLQAAVRQGAVRGRQRRLGPSPGGDRGGSAAATTRSSPPAARSCSAPTRTTRASSRTSGRCAPTAPA